MNQTRHFDFRLLTFGPVHIGSGEQYTLKESIYYRQSHYFPDLGRLYEEINKLGPDKVKAFENYLVRPQTSNRRNKQMRLETFLKQQHIPVDPSLYGGYRIKDLYINHDDPLRNKSITNVSAFIKNAFNEPYIPGSSLKGALRNIILNQTIDSHISLTTDINELFSQISVSDSDVISFQNFGIVPKIDYNPRSNKVSQLDAIYREAILPNTLIKFTLTTKSEEAYRLIKQLGKMSGKHHQQYYNKFGQVFLNEFKQKPQNNTLYIGGGSGFWTKVSLNSNRTRTPRNMKGSGHIKLSHLPKYYFKSRNRKIPLFFTYEQSNRSYNLYEMGKCAFNFREIHIN